MLRLPVIRGLIDRRVLVNYRCDAGALAKLLPPPFRPKRVRGFGVAGICLIRLRHLRPRGLPQLVGFSSENAAHRIAVEWDDTDGVARDGVFIPRRDTSSLLNHLAGGRFFPGQHHRARFDVSESDCALHVHLLSADGQTEVGVDARCADALPADSIFQSIEEASEFFRGGSRGFSPRADAAGLLDGLELRTHRWQVTPLDVSAVRSTFFEDEARFPRAAATFDNALLMRSIEHEWHVVNAPG